MGFHGLLTTTELARAIVESKFEDQVSADLELVVQRVAGFWTATVQDTDQIFAGGRGKNLDQALRACLDAAKKSPKRKPDGVKQ